MTDNVKAFPRSDRLRSVLEVLADALDEGFTRVVIIGWNEENNSRTVMGSSQTAAELLWEIEHAKQLVLL